MMMDVRDSVKEVKEWLLNKCRVGHNSTPPAHTDDKQRVPSTGNIVTPYNIPEFVIPGSDASSSRASLASISADEIQSTSSESLQTARSTSPCRIPHIVEFSASKSAPPSPEIRLKSLNNIDSTLETALQLSKQDRLKRLSQSANTRRKESLFHVNGGAEKLGELVCRFGSTSPVIYDSPPLITNSSESPRKSPTRRHNLQTTINPFVATSMSGRQLSVGNYLQPNNCLSPFPSHKLDYYRRRSSLVQLDSSLFESLHSSREFPSDSSNISTGNKSDHCDLLRAPEETFKPHLKRHSAPSANDISVLVESIPVPTSASYTSITRSKPCTHVKSSTPTYGELKISFQYLPASKQLKTTVIKAENLSNLIQPSHHVILNTYPKIYLMPGKIQKHSGMIVKRSSNPVYNQTFYFNDMFLDSLRNMKLRVRIFHKNGNFCRREFLGETDIMMEGYDLLEEQRMWLPLNVKPDTEELGYLQVAVVFEPKSERFQVSVLQARDLPKHHITGPPDPYVKVAVRQSVRPELKRQTTCKKKTTQATYKETFMFYISPKFEDLRYTSVSFTVFDREPIRSDDVIGQVRLGYEATEDTEIEQWNDVIQNPGKEVVAWHYIMQPQNDSL